MRKTFPLVVFTIASIVTVSFGQVEAATASTLVSAGMTSPTTPV